MTGRCERCGTRLLGVRYPLGPLTALYPGDSLNKTCERLGLSGSTLKGYMCHGVLAETADRLAARAGVPVYSVWPEMIDDAIAAVELECVECGTGFVRPHDKGKVPKYCGSACRVRVARRAYIRRKRADAGFRAREMERKRRYNVETREYRLGWQRRYDAARREERAAYLREWRRRKKEEAA